MDRSRITLRRRLIATGIALAVPLGLHAQPVPDDIELLLGSPILARGPGWDGPMFGPGPGSEGPMPPGRGRHARPAAPRGLASPEDTMPMPPMLRGLALTEAQADAVFAIVHAQAPLLREKAHAARHALDELKTLAISPQYNHAKAKALADAGARAQAELALLRADGEHRIYMVLTDEQREDLGAIQRSLRRP